MPQNEWVVDDLSPEISSIGDILRRVGSGDEACPLCNGERSVVVPHKHVGTGETRKFRVPCKCRIATSFYPLMLKIPSHDRWALSGNLAPKAGMEVIHNIAIDAIKNHHNSSFIFVGPPATYKTTFTTTLYARVAMQSSVQAMEIAVYPSFRLSNIWRVSAASLLEQFQFRATNRQWLDEDGISKGAPDPDVTREKIEKAAESGFRPSLFLYEIDKFNLTEFKRNSLFSVLDAIYGAEGQLVIDTNLTVDEFEKFLDGNSSGLLTRRVLGRNDTYIFNFFNQTYKYNPA